LVTKHMRPHQQLEAKIGEKVGKLEAHLSHFPPDATHLQVSLTKHPSRDWFSAALTLQTPPATLHAEKEGIDPVPVFDQAVKALLREVDELKAILRRKPAAGRAPVAPPSAT